MSQRSGQSVLYNPQANQGINATNTLASSGSNGSRHTNNSNHQSNTNGNSSTNNSAHSATGNILNHHYDDLQMNATGHLVPASLSNEEMNEYQHHQQQYAYNGQQGHGFAQTYRLSNNENDDLTNGENNAMNSVHNGTANHEGGTNYFVDAKPKPKKGFFKTSLNRQGSLSGPTGNVMRSSFRKALGKS